MRIQIKADGASNDDLRDLCTALAREGLTSPVVGLDGPVLWKVETPRMAPDEFARVTARLVKFQGRPLREVVR